MQDHFSLSDEAFSQQFADGSLNPKLFSHEAHLRLAFILIQKHGKNRAAELICEQIQYFDRTHGDGTKYHATLTVAAVNIVHHFMERKPSLSFAELLEAFPRLRNNFKSLIESHYSTEKLFTERAKQTYQIPDLIPF